jgi:hypothetical protein
MNLEFCIANFFATCNTIIIIIIIIIIIDYYF